MSTFPSTPKPASCKIRSTSPSFVSTAHSLRQVVSTRNAHRWGIELAYPPMTRAQFAPLWAFLNAQQGRYGAFNFVLPEHTSLGSIGGYPTLTVSGAGTDAANGSYYAADNLVWDRVAYVLGDGVHQISYNNSTEEWVLFAGSSPLYSVASTAQFPPLTGWSLVLGSSPAPTLAVDNTVITVDGASQTGKMLAVTGATASASSIFKAGDFIRVSGGYKTYQVTEDVNADGSGDASVSINTPLVYSPGDGEIVLSDARFRCALTDDSLDVDISTALYYGLTVELVEVLY